jgi:hypothetical protein
MEGRRLERGMVRGEWEARVERERVKRKEKEGVLAAMGYDFEMPSVKGVEDVAVKVAGVGGAEAEDVKVLTNGDAGTKYVTVTEKVTKKRAADAKTEAKKVKKIKT